MENTSMNEKFNFEGGIYTLNEVLKTEVLPVVARIAKTNKFAENTLIENKEVLLQRRLKAKFAEVRILDFSDREKIIEEKGIEFVMEHDNFVDDRYLMPVSYNGKLKLIHRPGGRKKYMTVLQVLQELPRYLLVGEDTVALPPNGIGKNLIVPAKTVLEIVRTFTADRVTYIECSDGHVSYAFSEKDRVNFIEVEDENVYHMSELVRLKLLPKVFCFLDVDPKDVVQRNDLLNSGLLSMTQGPIELLRFVDVDITVCWLRDNKMKTYETCIIPSKHWPIIQVQKRRFIDHKARQSYVEKKFRHCINTDFPERSFYVISIYQAGITWLRSPHLFERSKYGNSMFRAAQIDFQERPKKLIDQLGPTLLLPKVKEKTTVFKKVNKELLNWFTPRSVQVKREGKKTELSFTNTPSLKKETKAMTFADKFRSFSESDITKIAPRNHYKKLLHNNQSQLSKVYFHSSEFISEATSDYLHPVEKLTQMKSDESIHHVPPPPQVISSKKYSLLPSETLSSLSSSSDVSEYSSSYDYDYPNIKFEFPPPDALKQSTEIDSKESIEDENVTVSTAQERNTIERDLTTSTDEISTRWECEDVTLKTLPQVDEIIPTHPPVCEKSDEKEILTPRHVLEMNQSEDNFYRYSTAEAAQCFSHCGLEEFADECLKNCLDGSFFKNFDLQILKGDPFHLSTFQVLKVKKIIFEGWRPRTGN